MLKTLAPNVRLRKRQRNTYLTVRSWRGPIQKWQIAALGALKAQTEKPIAAPIARELVDAIEAFAGPRAFDVVVSVPCGHSGPYCLSTAIGEETAAILGIPYHMPFIPMVRMGSSHPKENVRLPPFRLRTPVSGHVLLVDDVATTGTHIGRALNVLRKSADSVVGVAWISGSTGKAEKDGP